MRLAVWLMYLPLSCLLAVAGSRWIDRLYRDGGAPLNFPDRVARRARWRVPCLAAALFACALRLDAAPMPGRLFLMAAAFFLLLVTVTDFEQYVIFDRVLLPFALIGAAYAWQGGAPLTGRFLAAAAGGGAFLLMAVLTKGAIGGGDIKLVAALGLWLEAEKLRDVVLLGFIFGGVAALALLLAKQKSRGDTFAYGPYFALTALASLLFGAP